MNTNMMRRSLLAPLRRATRVPATMRFMADDKAAASGGIPSKLTLNLLAPHAAIFSKKEVDMVIIPGAGGMFGVLPGHVPTISELKPGVLEVTVAPGDIQKFFISSGFAFAHANSTLDICAIEAVLLDELDPTAVQSGKATAEQELARTTDEVDKAKAQIAVDTYSAMAEALSIKLKLT